jgi:hypothetical protein
MMKYSKSIFLSLLVIVAITSCTERIDIQLDDSYTRLVVDGAITDDTLAHTVKLSKTSSYYYNQPAPPVSGAQVSITDGESTFDLTENQPGIYHTDPSVHGVDGHTYTLNIKLESPIGNYSEYSASSTLHPVVALDSISMLFHPEWSKEGIWEVKCFVLEPPTVDFYRFLISRNETLLTDSLQEWFVTDDKFLNGNYTNGIGIGYIDQGSDNGLQQGDIVTVEVNNIGKEYYNFVAEAQTELFGSNPLFSGPPANVKGNINNGAVGFFAAYSTTRSSAVTPAIK